MPESFTAYRIHRTDDGVSARFDELTVDDLSPGDVVVHVHYSSVNYKDALAATGHGAILRKYPLVGGIDLAGVVVDSKSPDWPEGLAVIVCGAGLSETRDGGYAEYARVDASSLVELPSGLDLHEAMIVGTAGLTAALAVDRLERHGLTPGSGAVVVTGASGGVGCHAIDMLASQGFDVVAMSGKPDAEPELRGLGAGSFVDRRSIELDRKPLHEARFAGAIDNLGGDVLAWLLPRIGPGGAVASIGLAASAKLETTVLPFILRGVSLLGINSVDLAPAERASIWRRIATDLKPRHLGEIEARIVELAELPSLFDAYISGDVRGRTVVRIAGS